jgi:hypothetical protein
MPSLIPQTSHDPWSVAKVPAAAGGSTTSSSGGGEKAEIALGDISLSASVEWLAPAAVLVVPGLIMTVAVLAQVLGGIVWIPISRRFIDERRRRERRR